MYRARFENLEDRLLFAADNLSGVVTADVLGNCQCWFRSEDPVGGDAIVTDIIDPEKMFGLGGVLSYTWGESQLRNFLVGDFNGGGRGDLAAFASDNLVGPFKPVDSPGDTEFDDRAPTASATRSAHDATFAELADGDGDSQWTDPRQQQIIAVLIGLLASRSDASRPAPRESIRITDGLSNTVFLIEQTTLGAQDINDIYI